MEYRDTVCSGLLGNAAADSDRLEMGLAGVFKADACDVARPWGEATRLAPARWTAPLQPSVSRYTDDRSPSAAGAIGPPSES